MTKIKTMNKSVSDNTVYMVFEPFSVCSFSLYVYHYFDDKVEFLIRYVEIFIDDFCCTLLVGMTGFRVERYVGMSRRRSSPYSSEFTRCIDTVCWTT
jgi:hypothetical protein